MAPVQGWTRRAMRGHMTARTWLFGSFVLAASVVLSVTSSAYWNGDYPTEAGPPIDALIHLRIHDFLAARPPEGPASLILRAPFAALSLLTGGGGPIDRYEAAYRFGVFPCVLIAGIIAMVVLANGRRRQVGTLVGLTVIGLWLLNPASLLAIKWGHPEELLAGALVVAAALAALDRRAGVAAALLAVAFATKEWAIVAVLPVAFVLGWQRLRRPLIVVGALVLVALIPLALEDPGSFFAMHKVFINSTGSGLSTTSIWTLVGHNTVLPDRSTLMPHWIAVAGHPVLIGVCALTAVLLRRRTLERPEERLLPLLALVLLLRALFDPINNGYYHLPFFLALLAADARRGNLLPSAVAATGLQVWHMLIDQAPLQTIVYLAWILPFMAYLVGRVYGVDWTALISGRQVAIAQAAASPSAPRSESGSGEALSAT